MNKFDKTLLRINGILFLGLSFLAGLIGLYVGYHIYEDITSDRRVQDVVVVDKETKNEERFELGSFRKVDGSPYFYASLQSDENIRNSSYKKSSSSTRNYFYYNSEDGSSHWLFPDHRYLIIYMYELSKRTADRKERRIGNIFTVTQSDSNEDGRLTSNDNKTIYISNESVTQLTELVGGVISVKGVKQLDDEVCLFLETADGYFAHHVDIATHTVLKKHKIDIEAKPQQ